MEELGRLRVRGVLMLTMLGWTSTAFLLLLSLLFEFRNEMTPVVLSAAINFANCLSEGGKGEQAEQLERQTLEALRRTLGHEHPDTLACEANLAVTLRAQGRTPEAEQLQRRMLSVMTRVLGENHPMCVHAKQWRRINRDLEPQPF